MQETITKERVDAAYLPLKKLMKEEFGITVDTFQMNNIIDAVEEANENISDLYRIKCDFVGCDKTATSGGIHYKDSGYWSLCDNHAHFAREGGVPEFKPEAIEWNQQKQSK